MPEDRSSYIVELIAEERQFAAGTQKAVADLNKVGAAASALDKTRLRSLQGQVEAENRLKRFNRLSDTEKLLHIETRRLSIAQRLAQAEATGNTKRASILKNSLAGLDQQAAGVGITTGGGGGRGGRGGLGPRPATTLRGALSQEFQGMGMVGLASTAAITGIYGLVRAIGSLFEKSKEASAAVKAQSDAIANANKMTEGTAENIGMLANSWSRFISVAGKGLEQLINLAVLNVKSATLVATMAVGKILSMAPKWMGLGNASAVVNKTAENMAVNIKQTAPTWLGGLGGTGEGGVITAQERLDKLRAKDNESDIKDERNAYKRALEKARRAKSTDLQAIDAMTAGGRSGSSVGTAGKYVVAGEQSYTLRIINQQAEMIAQLKSQVSATKAVETAVKGEGL